MDRKQPQNVTAACDPRPLTIHVARSATRLLFSVRSPCLRFSVLIPFPPSPPFLPVRAAVRRSAHVIAQRLCHRAAHRADAREARRGAARRRGRSSTSPNGMAFARSCFAARRTSSSRAATCGRSIATFPSCTTVFARAAAAGLRARRRDRDRDAARARLRRAAAASPSRRVARGQAGEGDAGGVRRVRSARRGRDAICASGRRPSGAQRLERLLDGRRAADLPDADDARSRGRGRMARRASRAPASTA